MTAQELIKNIEQKHGLSKAQIAKLSGLHPSSITLYSQGKRKGLKIVLKTLEWILDNYRKA